MKPPLSKEERVKYEFVWQEGWIKKERAMKKTQVHKFNKENGLWYIDLPEYLEAGGGKGDLMMVCGADTLLDYLSNHSTSVTVTMSVKPIEGGTSLTLVKQDSSGADYKYEGEGMRQGNDVWLCNVTRYVFGEFPKTIYFKVREDEERQA